MDIYASGWYDQESRKRMKFVRDMIWNDFKPDQKLLDIGCYKAFLSTLLLSYVKYYGIDFKRYQPMIPVKIQNLNTNIKLPFPNRYFNIIVCSGILEHLFYPNKIMKEIKRVLKDDGIVVISLPNEKNLLARINLLMGKEPPSIEEQETKHHWIFTPETSRKWVSKYFKIKEEHPYVGLWGRRHLLLPNTLTMMFPNLFCSDYFLKCVK